MPINRAILEAQLAMYQQGRNQSVGALEKAKAEFNAFNGAIDACEGLLKILSEMEAAEIARGDSNQKEQDENK